MEIMLDLMLENDQNKILTFSSMVLYGMNFSNF